MDEAWGLTATEWAATAALATIATALVAAITAFLVLRQLHAAREQLNDARKAQAEQERPYVVVSIDHSEAGSQLMDLVIQNVGKTPARNLRLTFDPAPVRAEETPGLELAKARLFNEPLPLLPPGRVIRTFFDSAIDRKDSNLPSEYNVQVTYENTSGERWKEDSVLDLDILEGAMFVETYGMHHLAKAVRELGQHLRKASILQRRGHVQTDSTVEERTARDQRVHAEQNEARRAHNELVARITGRGDQERPSSNAGDEVDDVDAPVGCETESGVSSESGGQKTSRRKWSPIFLAQAAWRRSAARFIKTPRP
ncbi:hypothetical protein ACMZ29_17230 [Brevibacterium casei]|uniref:hypothetical protein n=1 Tax=Brevibacterium casei TaxID=33889 RepID=UPI0039EDF17C